MSISLWHDNQTAGHEFTRRPGCSDPPVLLNDGIAPEDPEYINPLYAIATGFYANGPINWDSALPGDIVNGSGRSGDWPDQYFFRSVFDALYSAYASALNTIWPIGDAPTDPGSTYGDTYVIRTSTEGTVNTAFAWGEGPWLEMCAGTFPAGWPVLTDAMPPDVYKAFRLTHHWTIMFWDAGLEEWVTSGITGYSYTEFTLSRPYLKIAMDRQYYANGSASLTVDPILSGWEFSDAGTEQQITIQADTHTETETASGSIFYLTLTASGPTLWLMTTAMRDIIWDDIVSKIPSSWGVSFDPTTISADYAKTQHPWRIVFDGETIARFGTYYETAESVVSATRQLARATDGSLQFQNNLVDSGTIFDSFSITSHIANAAAIYPKDNAAVVVDIYKAHIDADRGKLMMDTSINHGGEVSTVTQTLTASTTHYPGGMGEQEVLGGVFPWAWGLVKYASNQWLGFVSVALADYNDFGEGTFGYGDPANVIAGDNYHVYSSEGISGFNCRKFSDGTTFTTALGHNFSWADRFFEPVYLLGTTGIVG